MKSNSMKPAKINAILVSPAKSMENDASSRPAAQPIKPMICSQMRPYLSASAIAKRMPTISKTVIIAAPFAARMLFAIRSLRLRI